jgi:hypothetical protein
MPGLETGIELRNNATLGKNLGKSVRFVHRSRIRHADGTEAEILAMPTVVPILRMSNNLDGKSAGLSGAGISPAR